MKRTFAILALIAVVAVAVFVVLGRTGVIDMGKPDAIIPGTEVPHSANENPPVVRADEQGCGLLGTALLSYIENRPAGEFSSLPRI
jgi:hypothetical protein